MSTSSRRRHALRLAALAAAVGAASDGQNETTTGSATLINLVYYFKGAVHSARFTRRALAPAEFLKVPSAARPPLPAGT